MADFLAADHGAVAELDLKRCFDSVALPLAEVALRTLRTPPAVVNSLLHAWRGPRICVVAGAMATPIWPASGLPQGDPCSPATLSAVLSPWAPWLARRVPEAKAWAFVDDRTLSVPPESSADRLLEAIRQTFAFDASLGLRDDKVQLWARPGTAFPVVDHSS